MAARAGLSWTKPLVLAALLAIAAMAAVAQSARSGSLAGRLTDLHSAPQEGATIILRNRATGAETHAITARNGSDRFTGLEAGEYTLEAENLNGCIRGEAQPIMPMEESRSNTGTLRKLLKSAGVIS